jgi:hypothetical protein
MMDVISCHYNVRMKLIRFFLPRIEHILFAAIFWGIAASGPKILNFDGDLPRHILNGNLILQTWHVSTTDIFSFRTVGFPSIPHEWLSQVIFALVSSWLGLNGIVLLTALIIISTWMIIFHESITRSKSLFVSLLFTVLAVAASQIHVLPRPHIFTYLLTAIWIYLLERADEKKPDVRWALPLLMLLWVNMHGMFVLGIGIWGIYLMGDFLDHPSKAWFSTTRSKTLMIGGGLSLATTCLSPSGFHIWGAIASLGSNSYITSRIPEYQSANFHMPETWPYVGILLLTIIGLARTNVKASWTHALLVAAFTGLSLYTSRLIPLFAVVATPIGAKAIADLVHQEYAESRFLRMEENISKTNSSSNGFIWLIVVILLAGILLNTGKTIDPENRGNVFDDRFFPVKAVAWLQQHPQQGHMFNEFDWGGYLLLRLWPQQQIFMDGHTHIYGEELTKEYERVIALAPGWENILAKYDITWVIVRTNAPLVTALSETGGWEISYQDNTAVILTRR